MSESTEAKNQKSLEEMTADSRALRQQIADLKAALAIVDDAIRIRHKEIKAFKALAKKSPAEIDAVIRKPAT